MYLDLPLERIHKFAFKAAEASHCARGQGRYWEMHKELFANQRALNPELLPTYAEKIGLDVLAFNKCLESEEYASEIRKDMALARTAGFTGTPSFGLGFTDPENPNQVKIVRSIKGAQAFNAFKFNIDSLLSEAKK